jgi:hypothetical protein
LNDPFLSFFSSWDCKKLVFSRRTGPAGRSIGCKACPQNDILYMLLLLLLLLLPLVLLLLLHRVPN